MPSDAFTRALVTQNPAVAGAGQAGPDPAPAAGEGVKPTPAAPPAAARQTPSRSARRKKLKRQLRAQGLLAPWPVASTRCGALRI